MGEPRSAMQPALGSGPGDQAPVAHGTRSRGDLSSAGAEAEAGAVQDASDTLYLRFYEDVSALAMSPPTPTPPTARTASACSATALA